MAESKTEKQKVQEITEKLEQGIKELFESEKYKTYLNTMSKFHNYSFNNTMLIAMQKPDATLVAGFKAWQKNFDRHVKKGEKGIRILAPAPYKIKEEQEKLDPVTGEIMLDKNGMPVTEEVEIKIPAFRVVPVFDVSQTDGKELPDIGVNELSGSVEDYEDFMQALTEVSPVPITYEDIEGEAKGYFHTTDHRIAIQEGMSQSQTVKTAIHEVAHAKLHGRERNQDIDVVLDKDRNTKEVEAESVAYTVCQHFGIDTSDYSFGYIAGWSSDRDMKELKSSLDTIRKTASELITGIADRLAELQKDRAVDQEQDLEESPANREEQLLFGSEDRFGIYQLKDTEEARDIHFLSVMWWCFIRTVRTQAIMWIPSVIGKCRSLQKSLWQTIQKTGLRLLMKRWKSFRRLHRNTQTMNRTGKMKCSLSITTNGVRSVRLTLNRITLPLMIRMQTGITDFYICRTGSRTSHLQECFMIVMRKRRMRSMKQIVKWQICLLIRKTTSVPTW